MDITELDRPVKTAYEFLEVLEKRWKGLGPPLYFRGEPKKYPTPFMPKIWRDDHAFSGHSLRVPVNTGKVLTKAELQSIQKCQEDFEAGLFDDHYYRKFAPVDDIEHVNWIPLAQHRGYPTRLVDITRQPLVALFFACDNHSDQNGYVYFFANNFNYLPFGKYSESIYDFYDIYEIGECHPNDNTLFVYEPLFPNLRMAAQHGLFTWCRAVDAACWHGGGIIEIEAGAKKGILKTIRYWNQAKETLLID